MTLAWIAFAALFAIWFGYPLAVAALAALRGAPPATPPSPAHVTAIVATRDDAATIRRRVTDLLAADWDPARIDVVVALDAAGARATAAEVSDVDPRVTVVTGDAPGGKAAALNAAVRAARGDVLVFADAGQSFEPSAVPRLAAALGDPRVGAASGRLEIPPRADGGRSLAEHYWRYERWLRRAEARVHSTVGVTGAIYAMRRSLWAPLPAGLILDDLFTPMRLVLAGYRVAFVDDARATDVRRFAPEQEFHRKARTLTGVLQLCSWLPGVVSPLRNPVWVQFVFHKLLRLLTPYLTLLGAAGAAYAAVAALVARPPLVPWALGAAAVAALAVAARPGLRRRLRAAVVQGAALQGAVVVATANGLRGRWDVWRR